MSEKFNVWILPYRNFRDKENKLYKNDSLLVARQIKDSFGSPVSGSHTGTSYHVDVHVRAVSLNMGSVKRAISRVTSASDVHLVLGLGIVTGVKTDPLIRFEKGASEVKLHSHFGRFGNRIKRNKPFETTYPDPYEASWYTKNRPEDQLTLQSIQSNSIVDILSEIDGNQVSLSSGSYYCGYLSGEFAKAQQISDIGFFIHIANLQQERDESAVAIRQTEVENIGRFIRDRLQIFDSKMKPALKTGTSK